MESDEERARLSILVTITTHAAYHNMSAPRRKRAATKGKAYTERHDNDIYRGEADRWQEDWHSVAEAQPKKQRREPPIRAAAATAPPPPAAAAAALAPPPACAQIVPQTAQQRAADLLAFIATERNQNTSAAYASAWRQFEKWAAAVENPLRTPAEAVDLTHPTEADVGQYIRYMVKTKGSPMSSVNVALAGISDRLRYITDEHYHPCRGKIIDMVRGVLTISATPSTQKLEMD